MRAGGGGRATKAHSFCRIPFWLFVYKRMVPGAPVRCSPLKGLFREPALRELPVTPDIEA